MTKLASFLVITLCLAGCNRQHNPQQAAGPAASQTAGTAAPAPAASTPAAPAPVSPPPDSGQPVSGQPATAEGPAAPGVLPEAAPPAAPAAIIRAGTRIRVRLAQTLSTRYSRPGERFSAYLDEPIVEGDRVIVPKGTLFHGHVTEARRSGRLRGRAYLGLRLDSFRLQGVTYRIETAADLRESGSHKKRNLALIGGGAGFGTAVGAAAGGGIGALIGAGAGAAAGTTGAFITGRKNVRLPVETPLVFSLRNTVTLPA